jgi:iron(III) transport system ATP-binding protein
MTHVEALAAGHLHLYVRTGSRALDQSPIANVPQDEARGDPAERPALPRGKAAATIPAGLGFEAVERRYGEMMALRGVSLEIAPSEVVCLLGPSGCGKTTLLRIAAGIEKPSAGRVLIDGREVAGPGRFVQPERRNVGLVFQDFALFPHLSILRNVAFGLTSLPRQEAKGVALGLLKRVGLAHLAAEFPHILSGGEQQRVALVRAIAPRPGVLLMDEPFSGLDVQLRAAMQEETLSILRETRATALIVTHDPEEAMRLADRIAVLHEGRVVQEGRAEELYRRPANLYVARLFSEINELSARIERGRAVTAFGPVAAPGLAEGAAVALAIRQRSVAIGPAGEGRAARVIDVKFLGDAGVVDLAVDGVEGLIRARVPGERRLLRGEEVSIGVDPAEILVFPARS